MKKKVKEQKKLKLEKFNIAKLNQMNKIKGGWSEQDDDPLQPPTLTAD